MGAGLERIGASLLKARLDLTHRDRQLFQEVPVSCQIQLSRQTVKEQKTDYLAQIRFSKPDNQQV